MTDKLQCPCKIKVSELQLGDHVRLFEDAYSDATVYQLVPEGAKVWRPYVHTGDVEYASQRVIPYIGIEDFTLYAKTTVTLLRRGDPKK